MRQNSLALKIMKHFISFFFLLTLTALGSDDGFRQWGMISGGQFEAKLNNAGNRTVELENREGKTIDFPIADLKPSDQQFVRDWQMAQNQPDAAGVTDSTTPGQTEFAKTVYRDLVTAKGKRLVRFEAESVEAPKYFAFYRSAMWCPPCRAFTPDLVRFYKKQKDQGAAFELIFVSSDKNEEAMAEYMNEYKMPWPAFAFGKNKSLVGSKGGGIPNLIVTDANGKKVLDSYDDDGKYIGPRNVMTQLEKLLKAN